MTSDVGVVVAVTGDQTRIQDCWKGNCRTFSFNYTGLVWHAKWNFICAFWIIMIGLLGIGENFADKQRKRVTILRFHFPHSLRLFSFSNPKFHVRLSNTLLYDYLSVARVADSNVLTRFVFAQQHSKVSVRSSFWTIISVAGVVVDVTGDQTRIQDHWKTNCNKTSSLHYTTRFWSESDMQSNFTCAFWIIMISLLSIGDNFRQTLETCDSKNFDMHTQKHIRLMYCASTPPLSSFVFVCFRFEPKVSCQTVKHTSLQLLESGKGCWQQRFNPFSICKATF
jgi:hypothetical protein